MALTNAFNEAVAAGNLRMVRIMMKDSLLLDLTFKTFKDMETAASSLSGLYEPHDGREFKLDTADWTDDYMNDLMVQVISNFSHERVQHLQDVIRYLRPAPEPVHRPAPSSQPEYHEPKGKVTYEEQKRRDQENGAYIGAKIAAGAVVGAAAGATIAAVASVTAAGVAGAAAVGAVAGGAAVYVITK